MTCGSCGNQNPPGARYCTRCGTELAEPTPIAAVAAAASGAMARAARAQAANAAQADPAAPMVQAANQASAEPAWRVPPGPREDHDALATPAYAAAPPRRGIAALLLALCALAAAVVAVWRLGSAPTSADTVTADRAPSAAVPAAPAPPPADVTAVPPTPDAATASAAAERQGATSQAKAGDESAEPVEITQLPARPATSRAARRPATEKAAAPTPAPPAPAAAPAPSAPAAHAPMARAPATVPSVSPVNDRWAKMNDELSRCTREDFITRVICGQRVRFRYCEGYWGKVDACPASPPPERGQ
jgi:hypothetical protein